MQDCRIAAHDLACRRGDRLLFRGLTLALGAGEAAQVAGANGIGKSSLIRILAGLLRPFTGNVERAGAIGLIDERPALDPHLPLGSALAFWGALDGEQDDETAARLGLARLLDVPVRYLSTGQRKRAALARLIGQRAPIWLLDEPLNGLDGEGQELLLAAISEHRSRGGAVLAASHQPLGLAAASTVALG
jgi:heme exporter protein A